MKKCCEFDCYRLPRVVKETGRFAYKSIRIQVDSHTSRFAYIEVVSPTRLRSIRIHVHRSRFAYIEKKKRSHKHSNRIALGQRNKLSPQGLYRYVRPQRVSFFSRFGHKLGIDFSHIVTILVINRVSIFAL